MLLPGRDTFDPQYRFGFNGKENDLDFRGVGQITDYGMRSYDARIGRFQSLDALTTKYPELTPYQYASNRPVQGVDLDGMEFYDWQTQLLWNLFVQPFLDFGNGGVTYGKGVVQQVSAQEGRAPYQQDNQTPEHVQEYAAKRDIAEGFGKQVTGATQMVNATADVVSTYVPLGTEAMLSVKASNIGKWIKAPKSVSSMPKPPGFSNWGMETFDDAIRTTEQVFDPKSNFGGRSIIVDENLSPQIAKQLEANGYNVKTFPKKTPDSEIIQYAEKNNSIVLTNNTDDFVNKNITVFNVTENMKRGENIPQVIKAVENIHKEAGSNPAVIQQGKKVNLSQYKNK